MMTATIKITKCPGCKAKAVCRNPVDGIVVCQKCFDFYELFMKGIKSPDVQELKDNSSNGKVQ